MSKDKMYTYGRYREVIPIEKVLLRQMEGARHSWLAYVFVVLYSLGGIPTVGLNKYTIGSFMDNVRIFLPNRTLGISKSVILVRESVDGSVKVDVLLSEENVWLTQEQMASLFGKGRSTITEHIGNIFKEGELQEDRICREFRHTTLHGEKESFLHLLVKQSRNRNSIHCQLMPIKRH